METVKTQIGHRRIFSSADVHLDDYRIYSFGDNFSSIASWPRRKNFVTLLFIPPAAS